MLAIQNWQELEQSENFLVFFRPTLKVATRLPPSSSSINYFSDFLGAAMGSLVAAAALLTGLLALAMPADCNPEGDILFMQRAAWQQPITALDSWDPTLVNPCT
ncbi:hypothetical protein EJB05_27792, partial [Eragrostis curvula]